MDCRIISANMGIVCHYYTVGMKHNSLGWTKLLSGLVPLVHGHCFGFHNSWTWRTYRHVLSSRLLLWTATIGCILWLWLLSDKSDRRQLENLLSWRESRFWQDIFHGLCPKCWSHYRLSRITLLHEANIEICKQFTSFLQFVKYTVSHLRQIHFGLFMQLMVYICKERKSQKIG